MLRYVPLALLLGLLAPSLKAQSVTDAERLQGYALRGDTTLFVFDAARYGRTPERVVVTGAFRAWSTDMGDAAWQLQPAPEGLWSLTVPNADYAAVPAATPFKFRVDDGVWLDPPAGAPNVEGGNLVFLYGVTPVRLVAELRGEHAVWVRLTGDDTPRPLDPQAYTVERWDGTAIPVSSVTPHEADTGLLRTAWALDTDQVHYVTATIDGQTYRGLARFDGLWRDLLPPHDPDGSTRVLGAHLEYHHEIPPESRAASRPPYWQTHFALFAPRADSVVVHLYDTRTGAERARHSLQDPQGTGLWRRSLQEDLHGVWYDYSVYGPDGPGSHFTGQTGERVSDPYALVSDDSWGRARVWRDDFDPPQPVAGGRPAMEDVVAYEVHVQDFTDRLPVPEGTGPLEAFATPGLRNAAGEPIGLDYLAELGVNTVHLMPIQEYLHYPDSVWQAAFAEDPFMQEQGIAEENYQWGYRTTHALAVESRFRSAGDEPGAERERFRDLVDALHARGMAVVVDVVFNHTGENMEGTQQLLTFNGIDKWYYYRLNDRGEHIGVFGNEVKSENRPFTQRWLLDQLQHYVTVFGVDGFRIDLAGQTDEQTLRWLQDRLGPDVLLYGEPWIGSNDPDYEANPSWDWYKADSPITFFQDDTRNTLKGPTSDPTADPASRGFAGGAPGLGDRVRLALTDGWPDEAAPRWGINYLDIHDNWALADRFASHTEGPEAWDGRAGVREAEVRLAAALLLTTLGPVVLNGGTEILRSKGAAPLQGTMGGQRVLETAMTPIYINGRGDTYNLRTANQYVWDTVGQTEGPVDYAGMLAWWRGLIALRLGEAGAVFRVGETPPPGHTQFLESGSEHAVGRLVGDRVLVLVNAGAEPVAFETGSLQGRWTLVAASDGSGGAVSLQGLPGVEPAAAVPPEGVRIWVRE